MLRDRDCDPPPHELVQVVHALKALVWQWTGQGPWLHERVSAVCGHAVPPLRGSTTARPRRWKPSPHDMLHVVHALNAPTLQSSGHAWVLHERVSASCGHAAPP